MVREFAKHVVKGMPGERGSPRVRVQGFAQTTGLGALIGLIEIIGLIGFSSIGSQINGSIF